MARRGRKKTNNDGPNKAHSIQGIRSLVKDECAGYEFADGKNFCPERESSCVYFDAKEGTPRCKYLEMAVLPLDPSLEAWYMSEYVAKNN